MNDIKNEDGFSSDRDEKINKNIFVDSISIEDTNNKNNKITPFRDLDETLTDIEKYVTYLEKNLKNLKTGIRESLGNAVKQEFSSLLN